MAKKGLKTKSTKKSKEVKTFAENPKFSDLEMVVTDQDQEDGMDMLDRLNSDSEDLSGDSDDEEAELEDISERLMSAIDKFSTSTTKESKDVRNAAKISQRAPESSYAVELDNEAVTMNALLDALSNTKGIQAVKKSLADLEKSIGAPKYVEKVISERAERKITYKDTSKDMDKWKETVLANRSAKTLDLAQDKREVASYRSLVKSFTPLTELEKDVQLVLLSNSSNGNENGIEQRELDLLVGKTSLKEVKEKQAELAKVKALMFYEQLKRHRLNKIKSKAYHKIRNRQKKKRAARNGTGEGSDVEGSADSDGGNSGAEDDEEATKRVRERMDLRHQNTGKWARMAKLHGKSDKSLKAAYHESILLGQELTKKINEAPADSTDHVSSDESSDDDKQETIASKAARKMKKVISGDNDDADVPEESKKYGKLLNMDFMKQAKQRQKERALEEAQGVLRQLRELEQAVPDDDNADRKLNVEYSGTKSKKDLTPNELREAKSNVDRLLGLGGTLSSSSSSTLMTVSTGHGMKTGSIDLSGKYGIGSGDQSISWMNSPVPVESNSKGSASIVVTGDDSVVEANPWVGYTSQGDQSSKKTKKTGTLAGSKRGVNEFEGKVLIDSSSTSFVIPEVSSDPLSSRDIVNGDIVTTATSNNAKKRKIIAQGGSYDTKDMVTTVSVNGLHVGSKSMANAGNTRKPLLAQKSQSDLVQMAFAGPDYEAEFNKLKDAAIDDEVGIVDKKAKILKDVKAGWGDWAVPGGEAGASKKTLLKRDRLLTKLEQESAQKKEGRKDARCPNVMFSERRLKGTAKFKISEIPHPFTTIEEYERSLQMPLGDEWNASHVVRTNTKPEILIRPGRIIETIKLEKKRKAN